MRSIRYPLSLRQVEDLLFERGIDICHETVRCWWKRSPQRSARARSTLGTRKAKFDNAANFRGFPHVPGSDQVLRYPDAQS
jgi:transposase-like protein